MRFGILYISNDIIMTELRFNEKMCALFKRLLGQWDCIISHIGIMPKRIYIQVHDDHTNSC